MRAAHRSRRKAELQTTSVHEAKGLRISLVPRSGPPHQPSPPHTPPRPTPTPTHHLHPHLSPAPFTRTRTRTRTHTHTRTHTRTHPRPLYPHPYLCPHPHPHPHPSPSPLSHTHITRCPRILPTRRPPLPSPSEAPLPRGRAPTQGRGALHCAHRQSSRCVVTQASGHRAIL